MPLRRDLVNRNTRDLILSALWIGSMVLGLFAVAMGWL